METKFTKGPWTIEPVAAYLSTQQQDYLITHSSEDLRSHVCRLFDNALCYEHGATEANAHLIAAAPDLLAALNAIVVNAGYESGEALPQLRELNVSLSCLDAARAALAKARGEI